MTGASGLRLVLIEWVDSFGCSTDGQALGDFSPTSAACTSVGWLLDDGDDYKVIVPHLSVPHDTVAREGYGDMTIPTGSIRRVHDLNKENP